MFSSSLQQNVFLRDVVAAADWCKKRSFEGQLKLPAVLSMDNKEKKDLLEELKVWNEDYDECSPAEHLTFVFGKKTDYDTFNQELIDKMDLKVWARFED